MFMFMSYVPIHVTFSRFASCTSVFRVAVAVFVAVFLEIRIKRTCINNNIFIKTCLERILVFKIYVEVVVCKLYYFKVLLITTQVLSERERGNSKRNRSLYSSFVRGHGGFWKSPS